MTARLPNRSTTPPNGIPVSAVATRKIPAMIPVAATDPVSRNTQKVTANHTVKLTTDTTRVLTSRCAKTRCVPCRRSSRAMVHRPLPGTDRRRRPNSSPAADGGR